MLSNLMQQIPEDAAIELKYVRMKVLISFLL